MINGSLVLLHCSLCRCTSLQIFFRILFNFLFLRSRLNFRKLILKNLTINDSQSPSLRKEVTRYESAAWVSHSKSFKLSVSSKSEIHASALNLHYRYIAIANPSETLASFDLPIVNILLASVSSWPLVLLIRFFKSIEREWMN